MPRHKQPIKTQFVAVPVTNTQADSQFSRLLESCQEFPRIDLATECPDAHWLLVDDSGKALSRCSLWWQDTPQYNGSQCGYIGHYAAIDQASGQALIEKACAELQAQGCKTAIGPIDGNTWRRYRLITHRGSQPLFFMESDNPKDWPRHFSRCGFNEIAKYSSGLNTDLTLNDPESASIRSRLKSMGVTLRSLCLKNIERELKDLFALSRMAFSRNFLYSDISEEEFTQKYACLVPHLNPDLVVVAERAGVMQGFMLCVPNMLEGHSPKSIILKTSARHPAPELAGLGRVLFEESHQRAHQFGYKQAIHAFMWQQNKCRRISSHFASTIREYSLFGKELLA